MKTIVLGNAPINNGNRGCVALSYCCVYLFDMVLGQGNYKLFLSDSQEAPGEYSISILNKSINYESIALPRVDTLKGFLKCFIKYKATIRAFSIFKNADVIADIGQGDSFADIYGERRFASIDFIHKISRLLGKNYFLLPQTIGPFNDKRIRTKAINSMIKSSFVMTRDKQSYDYVEELVQSKAHAREYLDVAFFLPFQKKEFDKEHIHVGLNVSALLWHGGYTRDNQFGLKCNYQTTIKQIINYFLSVPNVILHLIPHVVGSERHVENDYAVCFDLLEEYNADNLKLAPLFLSPIDAKNYISGMNFFMGARMHATIAAFSSGVPVVPMAYSRKFNGLFADTLQYNNIADMKTMTEEMIMQTIKTAFLDKNKLREIIKQRNAGVVQNRLKLLLDDLTKIL